MAREDRVKKFVKRILGKLIFQWKHKTSMELFSAAELAELCVRARELFWADPIYLQLKAPLNVLGDIHGQFDDLLAMFDIRGWPLTDDEFREISELLALEADEMTKLSKSQSKSVIPLQAVPSRSVAGADTDEETEEGKFKRYLFLGDYVDRGAYSMEVVILLCALKLAHPTRVFLLRGNHESRSVNGQYGFYREVVYRYDAQLYECFQNMFNVLPFCAIIEGAIMCMHGGISGDLHDFDQFSAYQRPVEVSDTGVLADLTWADPEPSILEYAPSPRGVSYLFGRTALRAFLKKHNLRLVVRGHQVVQDGYEFFDDRRLVTIFSAPNYCGQNDNTAVILSVDKKLNLSMTLYRPEKRDKEKFAKERKKK
uniref:Serine/threonine-protein phosphatase n=1 Tax=Caenorhabditis japonica TaxID=281687 RepID=A0A8R1DVI0_CAEJA